MSSPRPGLLRAMAKGIEDAETRLPGNPERRSILLASAAFVALHRFLDEGVGQPCSALMEINEIGHRICGTPSRCFYKGNSYPLCDEHWNGMTPVWTGVGPVDPKTSIGVAFP